MPTSGRSALTHAVTPSWQPIPGGITAPRGFLAAGLTAGLKPSGKPDLCLLLAPEGATCAGSFTTNRVRAAYNRAQFTEERRAVLQAWADYLAQPAAQLLTLHAA
jgi:N-acetylglutamate synthase/N-acetylornithine aminotransferase